MSTAEEKTSEESKTAPIAVPFLEGPYNRKWFGNSHNTAFAQAAADEDDDESDELEFHAGELADAPMFRLAVDEYERRVREGGDAGIALAMLVAQGFLAGTVWQMPRWRERELADRRLRAKQNIVS